MPQFEQSNGIELWNRELPAFGASRFITASAGIGGDGPTAQLAASRIIEKEHGHLGMHAHLRATHEGLEARGAIVSDRAYKRENGDILRLRAGAAVQASMHETSLAAGIRADLQRQDNKLSPYAAFTARTGSKFTADAGVCKDVSFKGHDITTCGGVQFKGGHIGPSLSFGRSF